MDIYLPTFIPGDTSSDPLCSWEGSTNIDLTYLTDAPFHFYYCFDREDSVVYTVPFFIGYGQGTPPAFITRKYLFRYYSFLQQPGGPVVEVVPPLVPSFTSWGIGDITKRGSEPPVGVPQNSGTQWYPRLNRNPFSFGFQAVTINGAQGIFLNVIGQCLVSSPLAIGTNLSTWKETGGLFNPIPGAPQIEIKYQGNTVFTFSGDVIIDWLSGSSNTGRPFNAAVTNPNGWAYTYLGHILVPSSEIISLPEQLMPRNLQQFNFPGSDSVLRTGMLQYKGVIPQVSVPTRKWSPTMSYRTYSSYSVADIATYGGFTWAAFNPTGGEAPGVTELAWGQVDDKPDDVRPDNVLEVSSEDSLTWQQYTGTGFDPFNICQVFPPEMFYLGGI